MSPESPGEFRRYRRLLSWLVLGFVSLGSVYLLVSVGVTIYRRRHAFPTGAPVGALASAADLEGCAEELNDVEQGLERHLENFHGLLEHYDSSEAQRWSEDRGFWLGQWKAADERCHYGEPRPGLHGKDWEELAVVHALLHETEATYTKELVRFGEKQAPLLDLIRERLETVGKRIGAEAPATSASPHPGDKHP
jgi:hypothetical protein